MVSQRGGALVFFSYARQDKILRDKLEIHLSDLKYRGLITSWHDQKIEAGERRVEQITINLHKANIILLLVSPFFMASNYCDGAEMQQAMQRCTLQEADIIPILLRPVMFASAPFADLAMLPSNGKPVALWRDRDSAFVNIAYGIERVAQKYVEAASTAKGTGELLADFGELPVEETALKSQYYQEMLDVYELALWRNPFDETALRGKANALYQLTQYEEAYRTFMAALQYAPTAAAYAGLGKTYTALQHYSEAVAAFEQAWMLDPTFALPFRSFIRSLQSLGRSQEVDLVRQKIIALDASEEDE